PWTLPRRSGGAPSRAAARRGTGPRSSRCAGGCARRRARGRRSPAPRATRARAGRRCPRECRRDRRADWERPCVSGSRSQGFGGKITGHEPARGNRRRRPGGSRSLGRVRDDRAAVAPRGTFARVRTVVESGLGFGFLAIVIGYFPVLYQAFSRREVSISLLDARAGSPPSAAELLRRHAGPGGAAALEQLLRDWERW